MGYDGIAVTDCQTGQVDIGRFSLENVDRLILSNGQGDQIFQPARFFASAGILNIQTLTPVFHDNKPTNLSASLKSGSWGLLNPSFLLEQKLGTKWALTANAEWMSSDGHYPYTLYYGDEGDQSSREKRKIPMYRPFVLRPACLVIFRYGTVEAEGLLLPVISRTP